MLALWSSTWIAIGRSLQIIGPGGAFRPAPHIQRFVLALLIELN